MFLCFDHQQPVVCTFLACEGLPGLHTLHRVCFDWCESRRRVKTVYQCSSDTGSVHTGVFTLHHTCNMHRSLSRQCDVCRGRREHFLTSGHYWFCSYVGRITASDKCLMTWKWFPQTWIYFQPRQQVHYLVLDPQFSQFSSNFKRSLSGAVSDKWRLDGCQTIELAWLKKSPRI